MTAKEYLQQAYRLNELIEHDRRELERLKALSISVRSTLTNNERVQGGTNKTDRIGDIICKIEEYTEQINVEINDFIKLKAQMHTKIMQVLSKDERLILLYRYMEFMKWEEIALVSGYTVQWVHALHRKALKTFEKNSNSLL